MRFLCALALVALCFGFLSHARSSEDIELEEAFFVDASHGWVSVQKPSPAIYRTSDGGQNWVRIPVEHGLYMVRFIDPNTGLALRSESDDKTSVLRTTDGGQEWVETGRIPFERYENAVDLAFVDSGTAYLVGDGSGGRGFAFRIADNGRSVQRMTELPTDFPGQSNALGVFGDKAGNVWIVGKELVLHSGDGGKIWENQFANTNPRIDMGVAGTALRGGHAWFAAANFDIYRTDDYGKHWVRALSTNEHGDINFDGVSFYDSKRGCAVGNSSYIFCTNDGGLTWSKRNAFPDYARESPTSSKIFLFNLGAGWAVVGGALYKTENGGGTFKEVLTATAPPAADISGETEALKTKVNGPTELAVDQRGYVYIVEWVQQRLIRLNLKHSSLRAVVEAPNDLEADRFDQPNAVATDSRGNVFIGDFNGRLRKYDAVTGGISVIWPEAPYGAESHLEAPGSLALDSLNRLLIVDQTHRVFRWSQGATQLETVAGTGRNGFGGDGGLAVNAMLSWPSGIAVNAAGDIFIADYGNCRIRRVENKSHVISTIAGTGQCESRGDGQPAAMAAVNYPSSIAVDRTGNLFVVEGRRVRRIDAAGIITTYAGTGEQGFRGDGGPADKALLDNPSGLAVDDQGNLYISDFVANRIRRVDAHTQIITTIAGNGKPFRVQEMM